MTDWKEVKEVERRGFHDRIWKDWKKPSSRLTAKFLAWEPGGFVKGGKLFWCANVDEFEMLLGQPSGEGREVVGKSSLGA